MNKQFARIGATLGTLGGLAGSALAAVPADVTTSLTDAKADSLVIAGAVLVLVIAVAAFKFMKRAVS